MRKRPALRSPPRRNSSPLRLIVGLGNPGRRYRDTFHNAGFAAADFLARDLGIALRPVGDAERGAGEADGHAVLIARPTTYMNLSGQAVARLCRAGKTTPAELIVVHDDLDLPLGKVRLKRGGGTGGHNGLRSLETELGTRDFLRVRVGIGRPPEGVDPADFVLSRVPEESRGLFSEGIRAAAEAVRDILREGFDKASTRWNARRAAPPGPVSGTGGDRLLAPGAKSGGSINREEERKDR